MRQGAHQLKRAAAAIARAELAGFLGVAAASVGGALGAIQAAKKHAGERIAFGKRTASHPEHRWAFVRPTSSWLLLHFQGPGENPGSPGGLDSHAASAPTA